MGYVGIYEVAYNDERLPHLIKTSETQIDKELQIDNPSVTWEVFETAFNAGIQCEEYMYLMCCDAKMHIIGLFVVSHGNVKNTLVNMFGIFQRALLCNGVNIIVAHNHPSGDCAVSREDKRVHGKLLKCSKVMGVTLQDNIILGNGQYFSFREHEMIR